LSSKTRKWSFGIVVVVVAVSTVVGIPMYLRYSRRHVTTDDAYVDGRVYYVTPRIGGKIAEMLVHDNQRVEAGQTVVKLDTVDLETELLIAQRNLEVVENRTAAASESAAVTQAQAAGLRAQLDYATKQKEREARLQLSAAASQSAYDEAQMRWQSLSQQLEAARRQRREILLGLGKDGSQGTVAEVELARAQVRMAQQQLDHAVLRAPIRGFVTRKRVEVGQVVAAGQPLFAVVPLDDLYVTANFKETQLTNIRVGQRVQIHVDTYPDAHFEGRVESIMAGTGSVFSLIPPEDATGNFVKVVQRIPVRIALTGHDDPPGRLRVGMSVEPTILVEAP
jgi:membrane fusion protein (multidrug efflux system)